MAGFLHHEISAEAAGLSPERLTRIGDKMRKHIDAGRLAGASALIMRNGHVGFFEAWGMADREASAPLRADTIFRIYSMTKAITGVAAMMLFEEGAFALADPVSIFVPEFREMKIAVEATDAATGQTVLTGTVPATKPITILDLFRHTAGFNYTGPHDEKGELVYPQLGFQMHPGGMTLAEFTKRLASAPLLREPGTAWDYGYGTDVLGRVVEVISGKSLAEFFRERIFGPLGMHDTGFYVEERNWPRFATIYMPTTPGGPVTRMAGPIQDGFRTPPDLLAGGAGLTSTTGDYLRFVTMLRSEGEFEGARLLSPRSVELMRSDLLGDLPAVGPVLAAGHGFGLTFAISRGPARTGTLPSAGQYRWGGAAGTVFWIDPQQDMVGLFMMQTMMDLVKRNEFMQLAYQATID